MSKFVNQLDGLGHKCALAPFRPVSMREGWRTAPLYTLRFFVQGDEPKGSEEIFCDTDAEAINAVNDRAGSRAIELWQADRMILWWPAQRRLPVRRNGPRSPFMR